MTNSNDDNSLSGNFTRLFADFRPKNLTQVVRRLYPSLIEARNNGYNSPQLAQILSKLMDQDVSPDNLRATLHRIKNERAAKGMSDDVVTHTTEQTFTEVSHVEIKPEVKKYHQHEVVPAKVDDSGGLNKVVDTLVTAPTLSSFAKPKNK
ncbi:hypothetical protein ACEUAI_22740 [Aeromonas veronii]